jgi:hypothetical protein
MQNGLANWIADGEKYALVAMEVKLANDVASKQFSPRLWAVVDAAFELPDEWPQWLGTIRSEELAGSNFFLLCKQPSETPDVIDGESQVLHRLVGRFYTGLLLATMFSPAHTPVIIGGARRAGIIGLREKSDLDTPQPQTHDPYPAVDLSATSIAAMLAEGLEAMQAAGVPGGLWRFNRTLSIYCQARSIPNLLDRIHQYCRCIDGIILPEIGKSKQHFKSRTELFIGSRHHALMGDLYEIRSNVEHLHENRYIEVFDRETRLDLLRKEIVVESIARHAVARVIANRALWPHFGNSASLQRFWALPIADRQSLWGSQIDPFAALADFDPRFIHDGMLGSNE